MLLAALLFIPQMAPAYYVYHPCCRSNGWWADIDYLVLWRKKRFYPPLVTSNPTLLPALGAPGTQILFGNEKVGGKAKSGFNIDVGAWMNPCLALGTGFLIIADEPVKFDIKGNGVGQPIFGRPFFNTISGLEDVDEISFPLSAVNGEINIDTFNRALDYDLYARWRFGKTPSLKLDFLLGFDYNQVKDNLTISTKSTTPLVPIGPTVETVKDLFKCRNEFYGGLVGAIAEWRTKNWAFMFTGKLGIGNMRKTVEIRGDTTLINTLLFNGSTTIPVGLLAQTSNIGETKHNKFEVVPQFHANFQWHVCDWCGQIWLNVGYMYMYWPSVVLAGDQVDLNINLDQPPLVNPGIGLPSPPQRQNNTNFWMQGLTAGIYVCY